METDNIKLCTEIVQSFSASTQVIIGAIATIILNLIAMVGLYIKSRKT